MPQSLDPGTVQPGQAAPDFALPLVSSDGQVSMADYRGRAPLFLALLRSFECPFCRRSLAALKSVGEAMARSGIETLVVTTTAEREARLYTRYRPAGLPLASDPKLTIHRAFGVPIIQYTTEGPTRWPEQVNVADLKQTEINPSEDWGTGLTVLEARMALAEEDGFEKIDTDEDGPPDDASPLVTFFLIDRDGTVSWAFTEALDNLADYGIHPGREVFLEAAKLVL